MEEIPSEKVEAALKIGGGQSILGKKTGVEQILSDRRPHWSAQEAGDFWEVDWQDKPGA